MNWILITILAYFIFAIVCLLDKYLLAGPIPSPKIYSFYIGVLGGLALVLVPFVDFSLPVISQLPLIFAAGAASILGLLFFYRGLQRFEASRITPLTGGMMPVFSLILLFFIFGRGLETFSIFSLLLLAAGTVLITWQKSFSVQSLKMASISAFFWAVHFVLIKYIYSDNPFWPSFIWIKASAALFALAFLFSAEVRKNLAGRKIPKRTAPLFLFNQGMGALANILQNLAIALGPLMAAALVPAFQGVQYIFLLLIAILISFKFPRFLKEEISGKIIMQKAIAILLIAGGILLLSI